MSSTAYNQAYYAANREACLTKSRESARRWAAAHPEENRARARAWYAAHPDRARQARRQWVAANREVVRRLGRLGEHKRRAAISGSRHARYTETDLTLIYCSQAGLCLYCGVSIERRPTLRGTHLDHMVPLSRGGSDAAYNIAFACASCNKRKFTKTAEEFCA
jgi:5-methylcytosine-specific restriction endonuclease McrA